MECEISVKAPKRDWQSLERKIAKGIGLEQAALQCGIPLEEVYQRVKDRFGQVDTLNYQLRLIAQDSLKNSLTKLTKLARGNPRAMSEQSVDLEAAKMLARVALDALKLAGTGRATKEGGEDADDDLFDAQNPWKLKAIE